MCGKTTIKRTTLQCATGIKLLHTVCVIHDLVKEEEGQTFSEEDDWEQRNWSLLARLTVSDEGAQVLDGMLSESANSDCWVGFNTVPDWLERDSEFFKLTGTHGSHCEFSVTTYKASEFYRSPLLNGIVLRPRKNSLIPILYTM